MNLAMKQSPVNLSSRLFSDSSSLEGEEDRSSSVSLSRSLRGEEGTLLGLGLLEILLLQCLLVESSIRLVLGGVLALVLALARAILVGGVLVLLGAVGDKVVRISTVVASFLRTTTTLVIQAVVVKPREPTDDQR
jgi:hypothetical protein